MHGTLGLGFVASLRKEWPMPFIAGHCLYWQRDPSGKRAQTARGTQRSPLAEHPLSQGEWPARLLPVRGRAGSAAHHDHQESSRPWRARYGAVVASLSHPGRRARTKQEAALESVHTAVLRTLNPTAVAWDLERTGAAEAAREEMGALVGHQGTPRWRWHASAHHTGQGLASVVGRRNDAVLDPRH